MRLVDPNLLTSETGKILVRDNAIVYSVEHVRIIITGDQVCLFVLRQFTSRACCKRQCPHDRIGSIGSAVGSPCTLRSVVVSAE